MNLIDTLSGSLLENFYPAGWDLARIDACCSQPPVSITEREPFWNPRFVPVPCQALADFDMMMGHEIALQIRIAREEGKPLVLILPVGPMGMYRWVVYFLQQWNVGCEHVHCFNMDEWADGEGNTLDASNPASFEYAMHQALYGPLGDQTVPQNQRHFATKSSLPGYPEQIAKIKAQGGGLITVFGIGRVFHIAFWEPHFAAEFSSVEEWKKQPFRLGALLHPLTIEQNAITSFKSRTTLVPTRANTIGPGLFLQSDWIIGGCDGTLGRGMQWQGTSLWVTLRYRPDMWVPSSFMPTLPGKLFFLQELAGPLEAECN
jgi:glucosamine-6-phosphate deaminase